jgi:hypothetical protein
VDQTCSNVENVLAVVEHQQPDPVLQGGRHTFTHGLARLLNDPQHRGDRVGHRRRVGDRCELEKPDPIGKFVHQLRGDFQCQPRLTNPAHPGQRDQPTESHCRLDLGDLIVAPNPAGDRGSQVPWCRVESPQWRKVRSESRRLQLKHPDRVRQVTQAPRPEVQQLDSAEQCRSRVGHQDLTAMSRGHHQYS